MVEFKWKTMDENQNLVVSRPQMNETIFYLVKFVPNVIQRILGISNSLGISLQFFIYDFGLENGF